MDKLREKANISYDEAKKILEETNGDILEAIIKLEQQNRISSPAGGGYYNSRQKVEEAPEQNNTRNNNGQNSGASFRDCLIYTSCCSKEAKDMAYFARAY